MNWDKPEQPDWLRFRNELYAHDGQPFARRYFHRLTPRECPGVHTPDADRRDWVVLAGVAVLFAVCLALGLL